VEFTGIQIDRLEESSKIVEERAEFDLLGAMRQVGAIPWQSLVILVQTLYF